MESRTFGTWLRQTFGARGGAAQRGKSGTGPSVGMQVTTLDGTVLGTVSRLWLGAAATDSAKHEDTLGIVQAGKTDESGMLFIPSTAISRITGQDIALSVDHTQVTARGWQYRPSWLPKEAPGASDSTAKP